MSITLLIQDSRWRKLRGLAARIRSAAAEALAQGGADTNANLTILLTTDQRLRTLNRLFRGKDEATNVLSFPAFMTDYLGDVALAYGIAAKEAKSAGRKLADHGLHLVVHGVLHLIGFDHATARQARRMEPLEARILERFGIASPYERDIA